MIKRGFTPQFDQIDESVWPETYFNDWEPTERDFQIIRKRINDRVAEKPHWYRYYVKKNT